MTVIGLLGNKTLIVATPEFVNAMGRFKEDESKAMMWGRRTEPAWAEKTRTCRKHTERRE